MTLRVLVATGVAFFATCTVAAAEYPASFAMLEQAEVYAATASGKHRFKVWIAADDASRQQGLMFVRRLPADRGMLFVFDGPQQAVFWMKDTYLPLDLVFIDAAGQVANNPWIPLFRTARSSRSSKYRPARPAGYSSSPATT
jgi:uncharacterized protein DUF192 probably involved in sugar metabolism